VSVNATREPVTVDHQPPRGVGMMQQHNVISDSGYWSPKNYNNSDYNVPTTKPPADLQRALSNSVTARPMVPPPAPPPSTARSAQSAAGRDRAMQNSEQAALRQPSNMTTTVLTGRLSGNRDSLPPPPPAPASLVETQAQQPAVSCYSMQNESGAAAIRDDMQMNDFELPPPPMPPTFDEMPPGPPSPVPPAVANDPALYPQSDLTESPLPLPPEDVNFDLMVVPPPPPPLVEPEQISAKLGGKVGSNDNFDRLLPDSASMSSEASSQAAKSEDASEAPVRDHRSDLLDAIRKGQNFNYVITFSKNYKSFISLCFALSLLQTSSPLSSASFSDQSPVSVDVISSFSPSSILLSITPSLFHTKLKIYPFHKSFPP